MSIVLSREDADRLYRAIDRVEKPVDVMADFIARSRRFRDAAVARLDLRYGPHVDETLDIFLPSTTADGPVPVHIFIHGGYWYQFGKSEWSFVAQALTEAGVAVVVPRYALCPKVGVGEIVQQMRAMLCWVWHNAARFGGDRERLSLSGHSAGGHLAMELLFTDWAADYGLPSDPLAAVLSISGLYDLRPLLSSYVQAHLGLSEADAIRLSPMLHVRETRTPVALAVADGDPAGFHDQLVWLRNALGENVASEVMHIAADHLTILEGFGDRNSPLLRFILDPGRPLTPRGVTAPDATAGSAPPSR